MDKYAGVRLVSMARDGAGLTSQRIRDRLVEQLQGAGISNARVLEALAKTPRHLFIDEALTSRAYENTALPIGFGQTISQPYIVALMTQCLVGEQQLSKVLEVGTGCGYQSAVLSKLVDRLYSVERIEALLDTARQRVRSLGCSNVVFQCADGSLGWKQEAPFDGILVAAAPAEIPGELCDQLAEGGRLVIPVGGDDEQRLLVVTRKGRRFAQQEIERVRFVPLIADA